MNLELAVAVGGHDDGHVDVAVGVGVALAVGAEHHDLRLHVEAGAYHSLGRGRGKVVVLHAHLILAAFLWFFLLVSHSRNAFDLTVQRYK